MRLLQTKTLQFHEFFDAKIPPYAILSHRWGEGEVTFKEMRKGKAQPGPGLTKIKKFCTLAASRGDKWAWIDTCCIDKRSSAELSEAINAMYKWYGDARKCYVYLIDFELSARESKQISKAGVQYLDAFDILGQSELPFAHMDLPGMFDPDFVDRLRKSSWFKRGWTLQELLAPSMFNVYFFDKQWAQIGCLSHLTDVISSITGIPEQFLHNDPPTKPSVAQRMSWASGRHTSRGEDQAYCLLGLFNVNMPLLYGEGADNAFRRLQIEIMNRDDDESLFAWKSNEYLSGMLAQSPVNFAESGDIIRLSSSRSKRCVVESPIGHSWIALHCSKEDNPDPIVLHFCSVNLAPMPHGHLPFHMSLSSMGVVFSNYESSLFVANRITNEILTRAIRAVSIDLARDPELESRPVRDVFLKWTHPIAKIALYIEPHVPHLTFGGLYSLLYLLQLWAWEYQTEQCSFLIWAWPGSVQRKLLGQGYLLMDPDPPLKSSKRI
ncbi:MAG: hypothetical protein LQ345_004341 [Seirophora villosa]|nr:MAG: hypothetical protein LQ345_004341 [Seirophora villosa]